jgi:ABC-2 type transport system ATP-binding protein
VSFPTGGEIRVLGSSPSDVEARRKLGYLPERLALPGSWKPLGYLRSVAEFKGLSDPVGQAQLQLGRVGLGTDDGKRIKHFSKGMRQRLALAAALLGEPELLVLDEPTDGVDPLGRERIRLILSEERQRGAAILLNSHLLGETERICDRLGILARGRLARVGSVNELCGRQGVYRLRLQDPLPESASQALGLKEVGPKLYRLEVSEVTELNRRLRALLESGALLTELGPELRPLEEVLAEVLKEPGSDPSGDGVGERAVGVA